MATFRQKISGSVESLSPRSRQWLTALAITSAAVGLLWVVFTMGDKGDAARMAGNAQKSSLKPTNVDLMAPGAQVKDSELWIGKAGRELEQYKADREDQRRINRESKEASDQLVRRFAEIEARLKSGSGIADSGAAAPPPSPPPAEPPPTARATPAFPPDNALVGSTKLPPPPPGSQFGQGMPPGAPGMGSMPAAPMFVRVAVSQAPKSADPAAHGGEKDQKASTDTFLPVSFTRGVLLGGLDAPTGGQSQANPHPVLIRLSDNSVLPNRFRGEYRECFVVAAGYGDISSERAYLRTENLSCVRADGVAIEVKIQGSVFGEDGKVGMRGRLVTKQGQMLANALMAGVMSGIGQGISNSNTTFSTSPLGSVASSGGGAAGLRAGLGNGIGKALDRLAQYYITLAEKTFPIIEIDAGRQVDVVLTKGVRIENGEPGKAIALPGAGRGDSYGRFTRVNDDED